MIALRIALILLGIGMSLDGVRLACKSKFTDLRAIIWCVSAIPVINLSVILGMFS